MSALSASNLEAIAYHLENGMDNGSLSRDTLAAQLRLSADELKRAAQLEAELTQARADTARYQDERTELFERIEGLITQIAHLEAAANVTVFEAMP